MRRNDISLYNHDARSLPPYQTPTVMREAALQVVGFAVERPARHVVDELVGSVQRLRVERLAARGARGRVAERLLVAGAGPRVQHTVSAVGPHCRPPAVHWQH